VVWNRTSILLCIRTVADRKALEAGCERAGRQPRSGGQEADWLGRKDSNLRSPDPESSAARRPAAAVLSQDSCSDSAHASSSHLRFSGESGAQPGRESGAHARNRKSQVPSRGRLSPGIVTGRPCRCGGAICSRSRRRDHAAPNWYRIPDSAWGVSAVPGNVTGSTMRAVRAGRRLRDSVHIVCIR
jgi:hypothetical protein